MRTYGDALIYENLRTAARFSYQNVIEQSSAMLRESEKVVKCALATGQHKVRHTTGRVRWQELRRDKQPPHDQRILDRTVARL